MARKPKWTRAETAQFVERAVALRIERPTDTYLEVLRYAMDEMPRAKQYNLHGIAAVDRDLQKKIADGLKKLARKAKGSPAGVKVDFEGYFQSLDTHFLLNEVGRRIAANPAPGPYGCQFTDAYTSRFISYETGTKVTAEQQELPGPPAPAPAAPAAPPQPAPTAVSDSAQVGVLPQAPAPAPVQPPSPVPPRPLETQEERDAWDRMMDLEGKANRSEATTKDLTDLANLRVKFGGNGH